jgi:hypothetical protein
MGIKIIGANFAQAIRGAKALTK